METSCPFRGGRVMVPYTVSGINLLEYGFTKVKDELIRSTHWKVLTASSSGISTVVPSLLVNLNIKS